jgi:hypothetical protein
VTVVVLLLISVLFFIYFQTMVASEMIQTAGPLVDGPPLYATNGFAGPLLLILYAGFTGARNRNKDRMGFFASCAFISGLYFIPQLFVYYGLFYNGLCGLPKQGGIPGMPPMEQHCTNIYGLLVSMSIATVLWLVASYKGYQLYSSAHFDPKVQDDMLMLDMAPKTTGYTTGMPVEASVAVPASAAGTQRYQANNPSYANTNTHHAPMQPVSALPYCPPTTGGDRDDSW